MATVEFLYRLEPTFARPYETVVRGQTDRAEFSRITLTGAELHEAAGTGSRSPEGASLGGKSYKLSSWELLTHFGNAEIVRARNRPRRGVGCV